MQKPITDHHAIRQWAESWQAVPAQRRPRKFDGEPAILTFLFGGKQELMEDVAEITWDHFFALFDLMGLAMVLPGGNVYELLQIEGKSPYRFDGKPV